MPRVPRSLYLASGVIDQVAGSTLFYPCTGADWAVPVAMFAPWISDFWFVDRRYFIPGHQDTSHHCLDLPPAEAPPLLHRHPAYALLHRAIEQPLLEPQNWRERPQFRYDEPGLEAWRQGQQRPGAAEAAPLIVTEHYLHQPSGRNVRLHRCRGDALAYFRGEPRLSTPGVFFYLGDSAGEGGSGIRWLGEPLQSEVLRRLRPGGLFVSDGSDGAMFPDESSSIFRRGQRPHIAPDRDIARVVAEIRPIQTDRGQRLRCVGYAGQRYGSTLVWQMPAESDGPANPGHDPQPGARAPFPPRHGLPRRTPTAGPRIDHSFNDEE